MHLDSPRSVQYTAAPGSPGSPSLPVGIPRILTRRFVDTFTVETSTPNRSSSYSIRPKESPIERRDLPAYKCFPFSASNRVETFPNCARVRFVSRFQFAGQQRG